jgi:hypothetical protein
MAAQHGFCCEVKRYAISAYQHEACSSNSESKSGIAATLSACNDLPAISLFRRNPEGHSPRSLSTSEVVAHLKAVAYQLATLKASRPLK